MEYLVHQMLMKSAVHRPGKEAVVHGEERVTYGNLVDRVEAFAAGLRNAGIGRGDRVGIYVEASILQVVSILAISRADAVFVPINSELFPEQVGHIIRDCGMKALVTTDARLSNIRTMLESTPSVEFVVTP